MCGIFGASLNPRVMDKGMTKAAIAKFKILGLYNIERGKHSCGIFMDNKILKGVNDEKLFSDFIVNNDFPNPLETGNFTMIGHTRMATHGTHTTENAHPFRIDNNFVLAHNGVIRNVWNLCNKYKINHSQIHVDSLGLAALINQEGFKVLKEYEGFAALLMTRQSEPNSIYIYRGASQRFLNGAEEEERPLFAMQTEEGMYFSSLEKSLLAISDSATDRIKQVEANIVHKITNGMMTKSKFVVDREHVNIGVNANTFGGSASANYPKQERIGRTSETMTPPKVIGTSPVTEHTPVSTGGTNSSVSAIYPATTQLSMPPFEKHIVPMIWHETLPNRVEKYKKGKGLFFHQGRYNIIEDDTFSVAHGSYYINKTGVVHDHKQRDAHNFFFYQGVLMKSLSAYNLAKNDEKLKNIFFNFAVHISVYCDYPVTNSRTDVLVGCKDVSDYYKYRWYQNGNMCGNIGFTPRFSDRNYVIRDGLMNTIGTQKGFGQESCINADSLRQEKDSLMGTKYITPVQENPTHSNVIVVSPEEILDELPFPDPTPKKEDSTKRVIPEMDITNFYRTFETLTEAKRILTKVEINAIRYYVADVMMNEMNVFPNSIYDDVVDVQVNMFLTLCIDQNSDIISQWDESNYKDLVDYLQVANENPNGEIFTESIGDEAPVEVCEFVPKPKEDAPVVPISSEVRESLSGMKIVVNNITKPSEDKIYENASNFQDSMDGEGPIIDEIVAKEQAYIPKTEEIVESISKTEERDYSFMDVIDSLHNIRDCADELTAHVNDEFSQRSANLVYRAVDPLMRDLYTLTEEFTEVDLRRHMKTTIGKRVNV